MTRIRQAAVFAAKWTIGLVLVGATMAVKRMSYRRAAVWLHAYAIQRAQGYPHHVARAYADIVVHPYLMALKEAFA